MKLPELNRTVAAIDAHLEAHQGKPRPHMGASLLGTKCDRWLWLSFRLAVIEQFKGRTLRLFRRGQNEEDVVVSDLRAVGMDVGRRQDRVEFGAHIGGSIDGVVTGVFEAPLKHHVLEIKTHNAKSFDDLEKNGVAKSKPQHFVQMQVYMEGLGIDRAFYVAICKDNDKIYTERVRLDKVVAQKYIDRGKRLALDDRLPPPISTDPSWYECKMCAGHDFCHKSKMTKEVNCRTCTNSTAKDDSTWYCEEYNQALTFDEQLTGCSAHVLHPDLVPWGYKVKDKAVIWITPYGDVENSQTGFHSTEIVANVAACADKGVQEMRDILGARVVE
jgi:hypothetical protein